MMQVTFLGTGTSTGIPQIGCTCPVCTSTDPRDSRLRTSAIVEIEGKNILIDCGPDFRQQMLRFHIKRIDAVLVTHIHYDHTGGIDDLSFRGKRYCSYLFGAFGRRGNTKQVALLFCRSSLSGSSQYLFAGDRFVTVFNRGNRNCSHKGDAL